MIAGLRRGGGPGCPARLRSSPHARRGRAASPRRRQARAAAAGRRAGHPRAAAGPQLAIGSCPEWEGGRVAPRPARRPDGPGGARGRCRHVGPTGGAISHWQRPIARSTPC